MQPHLPFLRHFAFALAGKLLRKQLVPAVLEIQIHHRTCFFQIIVIAPELELLLFFRLFQQEVQRSPHEYVILTRMNHAKYLLKTTSKPIKAIAREVGYRTESSFTNAFTEKVGISPRRFREVPLG